MKWFKHFSDSLDDPFIEELMDEYGHAGYVAWFGLIEIIAKENGSELTGKLTISPTILRRKLRSSQAKLRDIFDFCSTLGRLSFDSSQKRWSFYFPKMLIIKDNYLKDLQATGKKPSIEGEVEVEEEVKKQKKSKKGIDEKKPPPNPDIKLFIDYAYKSFNIKTGSNMHIDGGKDGTTVKRLLNTYSLKDLKELWDAFISSHDEFIQKAGFSIGVFKSQINKLVTVRSIPQGRMSAKSRGNVELLQRLEREGKI